MTADSVLERVIASAVALEKVRRLALVDTDAAVSYGYFDCIHLTFDPDANLAASWRVFDRVTQEIDQHRLNLQAIGARATRSDRFDDNAMGRRGALDAPRLGAGEVGEVQIVD